MRRRTSIGPSSPRAEWLERARLYLVCEARPGGREPEELLRPALQGGVDIVQLREKDGDEREIVRAGRVFRRLCDAYDALFIVNDRPELAIACAADGVHVGQDDADPVEVRRAGRRRPADRAVDPFARSRSTLRAGGRLHLGRPGVRDAHEAGVCAGGAGARALCGRARRRPVLRDRRHRPRGTPARSCGAGAGRVAVVRAIRDADDPAAAARALRARVEARGTGRGPRVARVPGREKAKRERERRRRRLAARHGRAPPPVPPHRGKSPRTTSRASSSCRSRRASGPRAVTIGAVIAAGMAGVDDRAVRARRGGAGPEARTAGALVYAG